MKQWFLRGVLAAAGLLLGALFVGTTNVRAQEYLPLTDEHASRVMANCTSALSSLSQLHRSDGLLRVNRGQVYEYIATDLMSHLNSRLVLNKIDASELVDITASFDKEVSAFRASYKRYEEKLSVVLRMDCSKRPGEFYQAVNEARTLRAKIYQNVQKITNLMEDYYDAFQDFSDNFNAGKKQD